METVEKIAENPSGIRVRLREYDLLSALEFWGVLGLGQLEALVFRKREPIPEEERVALFFNEYPRSLYDHYGYKRLLKLEKASYIRAHSSSYIAQPPQKVYRLTQRGQKVLIDAIRSSQTTLRRLWPPKAIFKTLQINAVGLVIREMLELGVSTRHRLRHYWMHVHLGMDKRASLPDLVVSSHVHGRMFLDISPGFRQPYRQRWEAYRSHLDENGKMLYLSHHSGIRAEIGEAAQEAGADYVYVGDWEEFRTYAGNIPFENYQGRRLRLTD